MSSNIFIGAGTGNSIEAQQFFDSLLTPPTSQRENLYAIAIDELVESGVYAKLDRLCFLAAADAPTGLTNLISVVDQAVINAVSGAVTFTVDRGFLCSAAGFIDSMFKPSTDAANYSLNDAMVCIGDSTASPASDTELALDNTPNGGLISCAPIWHDGKAYFGVNSSRSQVTNTGASGIYLVQRTASNAVEMFLDNASLNTSSAASTSVPTTKIGFGNGPVSIWMYAIGKSLTSGERVIFDRICRQYATAVGVL